MQKISKVESNNKCSHINASLYRQSTIQNQDWEKVAVGGWKRHPSDSMHRLATPRAQRFQLLAGSKKFLLTICIVFKRTSFITIIKHPQFT